MYSSVKPPSQSVPIKQAFHKLALKLHPDKNTQEMAEDGFKRLQEAHATLCDPVARRDYNVRIGLPRPRSGHHQL